MVYMYFCYFRLITPAKASVTLCVLTANSDKKNSYCILRVRHNLVGVCSNIAEIINSTDIVRGGPRVRYGGAKSRGTAGHLGNRPAR